ncbi:glycosyl hydrolase family 3 N terminal domain-containing protein [Fusarium denticulatum]|uniref:beta-glucosidase n=1 Tax=Fusarium denticulatum TaxID=48507 RepID=A0A8H5XL31_9HYPO|nr:glycosyl hydrolase family 3 N terminal domain-containing protein [Fusarium denticulatum]
MGVQASSKHSIGNEQETQRSNTFLPNDTEIMGISSNTNDRSLHEIYNRLNQTYSCENLRFLDEILRKELGFKGYVISDWFAVHSGREALRAGLDINMPGAIDEAAIRGTGDSYWGPKNITRMVESALVNESRFDTMVHGIMLL